MSVTAHPKYPGIWIVTYYPNGRKKDPATGKASNKRERALFQGTREEAMLYQAELLKSHQGKDEPLLAPTIHKAWPDFCKYYKNHVAETTYGDFLATYGKHLLPFFGHFRPAQLTTTLIEQYKTMRSTQITARKKPPTKKTVTKELCYLSAIISWMSNPQINHCKPLPFKIEGYKGKAIKAPLPLVPSRHDIITLIRAAERTYRPILLLCYYGGLRKTEALTLQGKHINFSQGYMIVRGKGDKERIVPIHRKLLAHLHSRYQKGYLFINPKTERPYVDFSRVLERAAEKAGIEQHLYLHLLRHGFGTHSVMSGIAIRSIQMMMGHCSTQVTELYTTLAGNFLAEELNKFGHGALRQIKPIKKPNKSAA